MTYPIEKGMPLPPMRHGRQLKYPIRDMAVGDSFFVPDGDLRTLSGCLATAAKRLGIKVTMRTVEGGVRVWRCA